VKVLLLHPDDAPDGGPWSGMQWDLVVDLGWAGRCAYARLAKILACPVRSLQELGDPQTHAAKLRELLAIGLGRIVDRYGIDWWEFATPYRAPLLDQILQAARLSEQIPRDAELVATRPHLLVQILSLIRHSEIKTVFSPAGTGLLASVKRYPRLLRTFTPAVLAQIAFDKWDTDYSVRRWFARATDLNSGGLVLLPSAYRNVTRTQIAFAQMLPQSQFLSVVTRRDGRLAVFPPNVQVRSLAAYVPRGSHPSTEREANDLSQTWLKAGMAGGTPELEIAGRLGTFKDFPKFVTNGLRVRDAWDSLLQAENIACVLSADENNPFTRLPVWLARRRGIPTVYAEHGALNFNLGLRIPCSDRYLARGEMMKDYWLRYCHLPENKIDLVAPEDAAPARNPGNKKREFIVFFSSDYESTGGRVSNFYREVLPPLCDLAQKNERRVILKLHPFESLPDRRRCVNAILTPSQRAYVELRSGQLDSTLLESAWIALTVESSAAVECALVGVPTFLCSWFDPSWWEYGKQFVRFSVAQPLESPDQIADIPNRIRESTAAQVRAWTTPITRVRLESILGLASSTGEPLTSQNLVSP
jgi:hypothetical protein